MSKYAFDPSISSLSEGWASIQDCFREEPLQKAGEPGARIAGLSRNGQADGATGTLVKAKNPGC